MKNLIDIIKSLLVSLKSKRKCPYRLDMKDNRFIIRSEKIAEVC